MPEESLPKAYKNVNTYHIYLPETAWIVTLIVYWMCPICSEGQGHEDLNFSARRGQEKEGAGVQESFGVRTPSSRTLRFPENVKVPRFHINQE